MSDRFRFRTPIYRVDGKFKRFEIWHCEDGFFEVARTLLVDDKLHSGHLNNAQASRIKTGGLFTRAILSSTTPPQGPNAGP